MAGEHSRLQFTTAAAVWQTDSTRGQQSLSTKHERDDNMASIVLITTTAAAYQLQMFFVFVYVISVHVHKTN